MSTDERLHLFQAHGVELEYMIVDRESLAVVPISDKLLRAVTGDDSGDAEIPAAPGGTGVSWSNELVLHVVELKTTRPASSLSGLAGEFGESVRRINDLLVPMGARLMPGGMHPWMNPDREMKLWPHGYSEVYSAFDKVFDCRGHGWANLQSVHLNLPFDGDEEFGRLHAAIRLVLPLLPALAASSPVMDGRITGTLDNRLAVYKTNARRVPIVSGRVIPEPVFTRADYEEVILGSIYRDLAPHDPEGVLRHEWANSRGAIARFDRNAIEIRVMDVQECPAADVALVAFVSAMVRALVQERWCSWEEQRSWGVEPLAVVFERAFVHGEEALIDDARFAKVFGYASRGGDRLSNLLVHVFQELAADQQMGLGEHVGPLYVMLERGPLARRILTALGERPDRDRLASVYRRLCDCLDERVEGASGASGGGGRMFVGDA